MRIFIGNKIYIQDATPEIIQWCKTNLEFPNPEYSKKQEMGIWTGNIERIIVLWERRGDTVILPYGCREYAMSLQSPVSYMRKYDTEKIDYQSSISLYPYQEQAVNESFNKNGIIVMPCGSGKTQTALEMIARYGKNYSS